MILNLEFKNYRSFKGICSFTTEPTSSKAKAENLCDVETIAEGNKKALKISLIFGANASGKTNIIKFLYGFRRWVLNLDNRVGENITLYQPFKFDSATVNAPIEFAMEFIAQKVRYKYEVRFTRLQIEAESLISYPNGKQTQLFERILLPEDKESDTLKFGASLSTFKPFQVFKNQLLISKFLKDTPCEPITNAARYLADIVISNVAYYVVKRSSAITVAAQLTDNWIEFPTLDKYSESSKAWNGLTAVTYEALIYLDDFATSNATGSPVNISSIMGVEQYLLLRIGDTNFERQQLQFDGSGAGSSFGKIPGRDATKNLEKGRWYHVACTYDQAARTARIYVDGQIQSEATDVGISAQSKKNQINLAMRALYDLWNTAPDNEKPQYETDDTGYNKLGEAYQFFLGRSYDDYRPLNGKIAEARVWSVARTPEQIWDNMYDIQNPQDDPTLLGYWKCNDASGNTVKDYSMYRNDGVAKYDIIWPQGIEIPKLNENNE